MIDTGGKAVYAATGLTKLHKGRVWVIDCIKAFMIIFVIVNHSNVFDKTGIVFLYIINPAVPVFMALSGYVFISSNHNSSLSEMYDFKRIKKSFLRYFFPMLVTIIILSIYEIVLCGTNWISWIKKILLADYGVGSYYFSLLVGLIVVMPIILKVIRKYKALGLLIIGVITIGYECICHIINLDVRIYRILVFRYLFHVAGGMYLYIVLNRKSKNSIDIVITCLSLLIGIIYLCIPHFGYNYVVFSYPVWGRTSMMVGFWVFPIMYLIIKLLKNYDMQNVLGKSISEIGKSSYHIMYSQMLIYYPLYHKYNQMYDFQLITRIFLLTGIMVLSCIIGCIWRKSEYKVILKLT